MKKIFFAIAAFLGMVLVMSSCEKKDNEVIFESGTAPVLSADKSGTIMVTKATQAQQALTLSWTNPNYVFNTGPSSQDVNYAIEVRAKDSARFNTIRVVSKSLSTTFTQADLNDFLIKSPADGGLGLTPDSVAKIEIRVTSFIGNQSAANVTNKTSNVLSFTVDKLYSVDPDLWLTGDAAAAGWTNNPGPSQKFTYNRATGKFSITLPLTGGKGVKFLTTAGAWQPQWGVAPGTTVTPGTEFAIIANPGGGNDPDAITIPTTGTYTITVDLNSKKATIQ